MHRKVTKVKALTVSVQTEVDWLVFAVVSVLWVSLSMADQCCAKSGFAKKYLSHDGVC